MHQTYMLGCACWFGGWNEKKKIIKPTSKTHITTCNLKEIFIVDDNFPTLFFLYSRRNVYTDSDKKMYNKSYIIIINK